MRVRWRRIFNPISRKPVRMKLTDERYPNARYEKEISAARISLIVTPRTQVTNRPDGVTLPIQPILPTQ
jgi:hypothetical protein